MNRLPFEPNFTRPDPFGIWVRSVAARAMANVTGSGDLVDEAKRLFGDARGEVVAKATTTAASTTGWGSATVATAFGAFVGGLRPKLAVAELFDRGEVFDLSGVGALTLPTMTTDFTPLAGVAEGAAIPVVRSTFGSITLTPSKLAGISTFTGELRDATGGTAEIIIREGLETAAGRGLDALILSNAAATATTPAGLLNGTAALTATSGGGIGAVAGDIGKLIAAIHTAGGGTDIIIFAAPPQAAAIGVYAPNLALPVIPAPHLAAGTIIAVEAAAFATGFTAAPRVDIARDATIHMETAPADTFGTAGSISAPIRSGYQSDVWALKVVLLMAYGMRLPGGAQWMQSVTW